MTQIIDLSRQNGKNHQDELSHVQKWDVFLPPKDVGPCEREGQRNQSKPKAIRAAEGGAEPRPSAMTLCFLLQLQQVAAAKSRQERPERPPSQAPCWQQLHGTSTGGGGGWLGRLQPGRSTLDWDSAEMRCLGGSTSAWTIEAVLTVTTASAMLTASS